MKEEIDSHSGEKWIELSKDEIKMGFLAQCVEALAEKEHCDYICMFNRLEAADMTEGYILKHYEPLHTQSWENLIAELKELLTKRESNLYSQPEVARHTSDFCGINKNRKMSEKEKLLHSILTATQAGTIVCRIANELDISVYEAFRRFIKSKTYANFRIAGSALSMCGDPAIVEEFIHETKTPKP